MIEQEIQEILADHQANELARTLMGQILRLPPSIPEDREAIARILEDVTRDLPVYQSMWIGFWLGCAWQKLKD